MDVLGDVVGEALAENVGCVGGFLPDAVVRWLVAAMGVACGAYLLLHDHQVTGTKSDIAGAALIVGSPILLILVPRWWRNI